MFGIHWLVWLAVAGVAALLLLRRRAKTAKASPTAISVLSVNGVLRYADENDSLFKSVERKLEEVVESRPKALVVRINSPGGTVGASQALHRAITAVRDRGIKVVALMEDVAASGGLYLAMAADHVIAHPGTITGSIGVIMKSMEYSEVLEKYGIGVQTIRSGKFKDILSPTRKMTDEERQLLQGVIEDAQEQFCGAIAASRRIPIEEVKAFADGRIMTGEQARRLRLVDDVGSLPEAVRAAERLAGLAEGSAKVRQLRSKQPLLKRFGLGFSAESALERFLPDAKLAGMPLWLMPKP